MSNTKDLIGEQETLDRLISHNLESLEDNDIKSLRNYCFYNNKTIKSVNLPNCEQKSSKSYVFANCYNLHTVSLPSASYIGNNQFSNCYKLKNINLKDNIIIGESAFSNCFSLNNINISGSSINTRCFSYTGIGKLVLLDSFLGNSYLFSNSRISVLDLIHDTKRDNSRLYQNALQSACCLVHLIIRRNDTIVTPTSGTFLNNTPIKNGIGWIYVPSDLVDTYKSATNWSAYADQIVSIDEYPKSLQNETISDSWEEIFQAEDNNTYKTKYNIGDIKYLIVGETYVPMQIIAFDRDILSSNETSTTKITWLVKGLPFWFPMNFDTITTGGWKDCECRKFLNDTIYEQFPENVRNRILSVNKTYTTASQFSSTTIISDKLWIPSAREIFGGSSFENSGIDYTDFFTDDSSKIKHSGLLTNLASSWWLRSDGGSTNFRYVNSVGGTSYTVPSSIYGIAIGFCT